MGDGDSTVGRSQSRDLAQGANPPEGNKLNGLAADLLVGHDPGNKIDNILKANGLVAPRAEVKQAPTALDNFLKNNAVARVGLVTAEGAAYSVPGVLNAAIHDATHLDQALGKGGSALALGIALRVALPKAGAAKAVAATAFTYFMARDAVKPIAAGWSEAWNAEDHRGVNLAAQKMGDGIGMFGWDAYWGMKIAAAGERLGETGMKGVLGEKRFNAFEQTKGDFLGSDKYFVGRHLNKAGEFVNRTTQSLADKLSGKGPKQPEPEPLSFEQKMERAQSAHIEHENIKLSSSMHKHGVRTTDGQDVGYSTSLDVFLSGKDPRRMSASEIEAAKATFVVTPTESGLLKAETPGLVVVENGTIKPADAVKAGTDIKGSTPELAARIAAEMDPKNIAELAKMAKAEMGKLNDEQQQVVDLVEGSVGPVHAAMNPTHKELDPGYRVWLAQMVALGNEVGGDASKLQQVAPLFFRGRDAAVGQMSADLGPTGRNVHSLNLFSMEMYTGLRQRMTKAGINANDVLAAKNPPLNLVARDGGSGPHTIPQIEGVWPVDLVHWPRNMQELRMLRAGINAHENKHDQYGGILRFAESIREQVIGETVGKALGDKATQMVDVPGHGQMSKKDLIVSILKAQANENTADMGGAAHLGPNSASALGILLQGLREGGQLETRNVFGKELASKENPMGIEAHAIDTFRPKLVAEVLRQRANGDPMLLEYAKQLDAYAEAASRGGEDYVWASIDNPGQKISIPRKELDAVIPHLVKAQFNTPLEALKGKTYAEILPDLPSEVKKMDALADLMVDVIQNKKPLESIPFDTKDFSMMQLQGAALPAALRLASKGMKGPEINAEINRVSDFLELKFHEHGDPHIDPLIPRVTIGQIALNPALAARTAGKGIANTLVGVRDWSGRDRFLTGYGGMAIGRDIFSTYQPGSVSRALVNGPQPGDNTASGGAQNQDQQRSGIPDLPTDKVVIPDGPPPSTNLPRTIPRPVEPFEQKDGTPFGTRRRNGTSIDFNELREIQRQGDKWRQDVPTKK